MGKRKRRNFTPEQRAAAVRIVETSGKPIAQVAREMDLSVSEMVAQLRFEHPLHEAFRELGNDPVTPKNVFTWFVLREQLVDEFFLDHHRGGSFRAWSPTSAYGA